MKILIIANARYKGGLSGSDNIYLNFKKHWPADIDVDEMMSYNYKPFWVCYLHRILLACIEALVCWEKYDVVYSASDFLMDSLPAFIMKLKGVKWWAGFYLFAPKENWKYCILQKIALFFIRRFADQVFITNGSMKSGFPNQKTVEVNGGVDLGLAYTNNVKYKYDVVFVGRIHPTKGIVQLRHIAELMPDLKIAVIGDGDLGKEYILERNCNLLGYMGDERFNVYRRSKVVIYTTPKEHDHFSMAPVEAMACGCPMVAFNIPVMKYIKPQGTLLADDILDFTYKLRKLVDGENYLALSLQAREWALSWDWKYKAVTIWKEATT